MKKTDRRSREQIVEPLNPTPEFMTMGNGFHQITSYGALIVGEKGFEYYNERTLKDFIQIPWEELDLIIGSIYFGGRFILPGAFSRGEDRQVQDADGSHGSETAGPLP